MSKKEYKHHTDKSYQVMHSKGTSILPLSAREFSAEIQEKISKLETTSFEEGRPEELLGNSGEDYPIGFDGDEFNDSFTRMDHFSEKPKIASDYMKLINDMD